MRSSSKLCFVDISFSMCIPYYNIISLYIFNVFLFCVLKIIRDIATFAFIVMGYIKTLGAHAQRGLQ